ncbi:CPBP family intramembrane glutamic endopeptidase [Corynebacterium sp. 13CS0277]|uniref:CPBP family intramembrane glutamic endopeptidase n=1 Tax=Corynebacterium sp. 13CS0277 TaxID=2071994 RepID=UPI001304F282|nr:type II CAAX endopeptidase family protein [Corynebacterium sp. 13CS0277]
MALNETPIPVTSDASHAAARVRFPRSIWAEEPTTTPAPLTWRDLVAAAAIPVIFFVGIVGMHLTDGRPGEAFGVRLGLVDVVVRVALCVALVVAYRQMFAHNWAALKRAPWATTGIVIAGAIGLQVAIALGRLVIPTPTPGADSGDSAQQAVTWGSLALQAVLLISPVVTVFIEEVVFRYTFLQRLPVWSHPVLLAVAVVLNSMVFGAIHYYNFGGDIVQTIPYMFAGLLMNLMYLWTRNVWVPALMHLVNNVLLTYGGLILLAVFHLFGLTEAMG